MNEKHILAFDFGASSGRAMLGIFNGKNINIHEVHRFSNDPVIVNKTMYWDYLRLFFEIKQSLIKAKEFGKIDSIGIDTWGVDFALLDSDGDILENPIHYRDARTIGMIEESFKSIDKEKFYDITGNQFMEHNTAFQLLSLTKKRNKLLSKADKMLLMPDVFNYLLTGEKVAEISIASTTQLFDANKRDWSSEVISSLKIPENIFPKIVKSGDVIGKISKQICEELEIETCDVIAVCGHDTQSAIVSVPTQEEDFVFLSCGTWSLLGTELKNPIINEKSIKYNITNEAGFGDSVSFLKNIIGLWLVQESRRQWIREGKEFSFASLEKMAEKETPFRCFIDPDDKNFVAAGNIPQKIKEYCKQTNQREPTNEAQVVRAINESLAMKYKVALEEIEECTGKKYKALYMLGGGIQSKLLCQMTANSCGITVYAGPIEATVLGNMAVQLMGTGDIKDIKSAREIIAKTSEIITYTPQNSELWETAYEVFKEVTKC